MHLTVVIMHCLVLVPFFFKYIFKKTYDWLWTCMFIGYKLVWLFSNTFLTVGLGLVSDMLFVSEINHVS